MNSRTAIRTSIRWVFAMVFFVSATCASAHSEFGLEGQPAPACSHEPSSEDQQPVQHCTECMQVDYLQESASLLDVVQMAAVPCYLSLPSQEISFVASPAFRLVPPEPISSSPPVLRI